MGMKNIVLLPLFIIIASGCHTVGDALNPVTYYQNPSTPTPVNSDKSDTPLANSENVQVTYTTIEEKTFRELVQKLIPPPTITASVKK